MTPHMKPAHYKPEQVEEHSSAAQNGYGPALEGRPRNAQPFRKPTRETREAAERAIRSALMDCYNG